MSSQIEPAGAQAITSLSERRVDDSTGTLTLMREALFLNEEVYTVVRDSRSPLGRGFAAILWILIIVVVARGVALLTGLLTTPRLDILQNQFYEALTGMELYQAQVERSAEFAQQFWQGYTALWESLRVLGGFPSTTGTLVTITAAVLFTLLGWFFYGLIAHWTARWFGGSASFGQFLGGLAFSYAPLLLTAIMIIPGARIAVPVILLLLLVTHYQAIKSTHRLTPGYSLAVLFTPYVLGIILMTGIIIFGMAYGVAQIPHIEEIMRAWNLFRLF